VLGDTVFEDCPSNALGELAKVRSSRSYAPDATIFSEGEPVSGAFCICSGAVVIRKRDEQGIEHDVARMGPGSLIGFRSITGQDIHCVSASARSEVVACFIPIEEMFELVARYPSILLHLIESFCHRIGELREHAD
jgi:CRP-like cAMP-binding protein